MMKKDETLSFDEYSIIYEELLLRHEASEETFQQIRTKIASIGNQEHVNERSTTQTREESQQQVSAAVIRTRSELLGMLQCASRECDQTATTTTVTNASDAADILAQTRVLLDSSSSNAQIDICWSNCGERDKIFPTSSRQNITGTVSRSFVDVEVFFEEYPEFVRYEYRDSDNDEQEDSVASSSSLSSCEDSRCETKHGGKHSSSRKRQREATSSSNNDKKHPSNDKQWSSKVSSEKIIQDNPSKPQPAHDHLPARPQSSGSQQTINSTRNHVGNSNFSYTPSTPVDTLVSQQQQQKQQQQIHQQPQQQDRQVSTATRNPYAKRPPPPRPAAVKSNNDSNMLPSSWEELRNGGMNHFQTAREVDTVDAGHSSDWSHHAQNYHQQQSEAPLEPRVVAQQTLQPPIQQTQQQYPESSTAEKLVIRDSLRRKFQPPKRAQQPVSLSTNKAVTAKQTNMKSGTLANKGSSQPQHIKRDVTAKDSDEDDDLPEELKRFGKELVEKIESEIMCGGDPTTFDDIAGLEDAKQTIQEVICWPMKRPDLFTGLRRAPNALLLYGPPGTGKTLIGKAIAHESGATFFSISSSSLTSKWIGEGEKLVRTMFAVAAYREPSVVFIDEIDSLLTQRKSDENEASRRIKTEFLVQMDGTSTSGQGRVLTIGATNRPQELDEAARRRFVKRLYIPLPDQQDRLVLIRVMLRKNKHSLTDNDLAKLANETDRFSGADLKALCTDAALGPLRGLPPSKFENVNAEDLPPISFKHFRLSLRAMKPSVSPDDLVQYEEWDQVYGSKRADPVDEEEDE